MFAYSLLAIALTLHAADAAGTFGIPLLKNAHPAERLFRRGLLPRQASGTSLSSLFPGYDFYSKLGFQGYYLNMTVGTPGQLLTVQVDTGSSDLFVTASNASFCSGPVGCAGGTFDPSRSSTYQVLVPGGYNSSFGDGTTEAGDLFTDIVQVGDISLRGVELGVAYDVFSPVGANTALMGVGYSTNEGTSTGINYPNFVDSLIYAGAIASRFYSLFLNDIHEYGAILFGGVDTSRYTGDLSTLSFIPDPSMGFVSNFGLYITNVSVDQEGKKTSIFTSTSLQDALGPVIPDSGSTAWQVSPEVFNSVLSVVNVDNSLNAPCSSTANGTVFTITFQGAADNSATLQVPLENLFIPNIDNTTGAQITDAKGNALCGLSLQQGQTSSTVPYLVVGDAIMRSGYWVFDLDNGQVSVAQAAVNSTNPSKIVPVPSGPHGLQGALHLSASAPQQTLSVASPVSPVNVSYTLETASSTVGVVSAGATGVAPTISGPSTSGPTASLSSAAMNVHMEPASLTSAVLGGVLALSMLMGAFSI